MIGGTLEGGVCLKAREHLVHACHAVGRHSAQDAPKDVHRGLGGLLACQGVQCPQGNDLQCMWISDACVKEDVDVSCPV